MIGSTYTLTGSRVIRCERKATPEAVQGIFGGVLADPQRSRFMANVWEEQPASVLAAGRFAGDGLRLDANVPASRDLMFFVPRGRYQLLRFRAQLFAVSASIPLAERPTDKRHKLIYGKNLFVVWRVADSNWFHDLVYGREREMITRYTIVSRPTATSASPDIVVAARFPNPTWRGGVPSEASLETMFAPSNPKHRRRLSRSRTQSSRSNRSPPRPWTTTCRPAAPERPPAHALARRVARRLRASRSPDRSVDVIAPGVARNLARCRPSFANSGRAVRRIWQQRSRPATSLVALRASM